MLMTKETRAQRKRRQNREALLDAAEFLIEENGPDAATVQAIADRADLALGTFYSYFDSKYEIAATIMNRTMARMGLCSQKPFQQSYEVLPESGRLQQQNSVKGSAIYITFFVFLAFPQTSCSDLLTTAGDLGH